MRYIEEVIQNKLGEVRLGNGLQSGGFRTKLFYLQLSQLVFYLLIYLFNYELSCNKQQHALSHY